MPVSICIEDGDVIDEDGVLEYFYGENRETLMAGGYIEEEKYQDCPIAFFVEKDNIELNYMYTSDFEEVGGRNSFSLCDMREAAGEAYAGVLRRFDSQESVSNRFKTFFPETELDWCSKEEAIAACDPLAKACGYEDAEVSAYAMTVETLSKLADDYAKSSNYYYYLNPPSPDYDVIEWDIRKKGDAWTKQYEAYFVVYQTVLNGLVLDSDNYYLWCVYAPAYGRVVYAHCDQSLRLVSTLETTLVIQKDSLLQAIDTYLEESSGSITITGVSMAYAPQYAKMGEHLEVRTIDPCWRIDYTVSESMKYSPGYQQDDWTVMVNAVDGSFIKFSGLE